MTSKPAIPQRVLFACTGNTCRSVFAEYLARDAFGDTVTFESAGITPQEARDADNAVYTLKKNFNIDASKHIPRDIRLFDLTQYILIIAFEKRVASLVRDLGVPASKVKLWKVDDPWGPDLTQYDKASLEIKPKVLQLKGSGRHGDEA